MYYIYFEWPNHPPSCTVANVVVPEVNGALALEGKLWRKMLQSVDCLGFESYRKEILFILNLFIGIRGLVSF